MVGPEGVDAVFLLKELLFALPLIAYAYVRILLLFKRTVPRVLFTAAFALLLAGFPIAETLAHSRAGAGSKLALIAGYDALPLLLYLVLTALASDVLIAAARGLGVVSRETVRAPRFRRIRLAVALLVPALVVAVGIVNYRHLRVREYTVEVPRRAASVDSLTLVFAADLHIGPVTDRGFPARFVDKVNAAAPDLVLIGGDILEGDRSDEDTAEFEAQFRRLRPRFGIYAAPGNHEGHRGRGNEVFARAGIRMLEDEVARIDAAVLLAGRKDEHSRGRKTVADLLRDAPGDLPVVLLDHRPTDLDNISRAGVDLSLSGHTHHGQLFPVNWLTGLEYEVSWGHIRKGRTEVFVTSGAQNWGPPVRTVGYSEILLIHVLFR